MKYEKIFVPGSVDEIKIDDKKDVLFIGDEIPPIFGRIKFNGNNPSIAVMDSSGEIEYENISNYHTRLQEKTGVIVFTPEELKNLFTDAYALGYFYAKQEDGIKQSGIGCDVIDPEFEFYLQSKGIL